MGADPPFRAATAGAQAFAVFEGWDTMRPALLPSTVADFPQRGLDTSFLFQPSVFDLRESLHLMQHRYPAFENREGWGNLTDAGPGKKAEDAPVARVGCET